MIMAEEENTLKEGLIAATTTITVGILNETFPRADDGEPLRRTNMRVRKQRGLAHLETLKSSSPLQPSSPWSKSQQQHRNLVYYTDDYPVTIDRILDVETNCAPGQNCLLVISTITVVLEPGDDPDLVNDVLVKGMQDSFNGTPPPFFLAIPPDTVICPT